MQTNAKYCQYTGSIKPVSLASMQCPKGNSDPYIAIHNSYFPRNKGEENVCTTNLGKLNCFFLLFYCGLVAINALRERMVFASCSVRDRCRRNRASVNSTHPLLYLAF